MNTPSDDSAPQKTFTLINVDTKGLSESAKLLIDRVCDAVGGLSAPWQIRRLAKANADADYTRAEGEVAVSDLQRRAAQRWLSEEERKQANMEIILAKAAQQIGEDAKPEKIDADWLANYFEQCRNTSDRELQELWAKVLAGEANAPGSFSKRTANLVASLDKVDAEYFKALRNFCYKKVVGLAWQPLVFNAADPIFTANGLNWGKLKHLNEVGLVSFETSRGMVLNLQITKQPEHWISHLIRLEYADRSCLLRAPNNQLPLGTVKLTRIGEDLASVVPTNAIEGYFDYTVSELRKQGAIVQELKPGESLDPKTFYPDGFPPITA